MVEGYCRIAKPEVNGILPTAEKERAEQQFALKREKMLLVANTIGAGGNLVKFITPPICCNPCALNAAQWFALIRSGLRTARAACREKSAEFVLDGRYRINQEWERLLEGEQNA